MQYLVLFYYYYLTAMGLTPGGSSTVHIYTQTLYIVNGFLCVTVTYTFIC
jgi:hypothetical protein